MTYLFSFDQEVYGPSVNTFHRVSTGVTCSLFPPDLCPSDSDYGFRYDSFVHKEDTSYLLTLNVSL